jgi:hypothetical protein
MYWPGRRGIFCQNCKIVKFAILTTGVQVGIFGNIGVLISAFFKILDLPLVLLFKRYKNTLARLLLLKGTHAFKTPFWIIVITTIRTEQ